MMSLPVTLYFYNFIWILRNVTTGETLKLVAIGELGVREYHLTL